MFNNRLNLLNKSKYYKTDYNYLIVNNLGLIINKKLIILLAVLLVVI